MAVKNRVKVSAAYNSFIQEINRLEKFDASNHGKFARRELTKPQIELLSETVFFYAFRAYEAFIR